MSAMNDHITEWLNYCKVTMTRNTLYNYEWHIHTLASTAPERRAQDWTKAQLLAYLGKMFDKGLSDAYRKQAVFAIRGFFAYTLLEASPAKGLPYPKLKKKRQRVVTVDAARRLFAACDGRTSAGKRDLALFSLMLDTGLRASEVCRLKLGDVDLKARRLVVIVKGGNEGVGVFSRLTQQRLLSWLHVRPKHATKETETLFCSIGGLRRGTALHRSGLRCILRKLSKRAGIGLVSPHDFRRSFATIAIRNGAPTRVVQAAGRWEDLLMVERYTAGIDAQDFEGYYPVETVAKGKNQHGR